MYIYTVLIKLTFQIHVKSQDTYSIYSILYSNCNSTFFFAATLLVTSLLVALSVLKMQNIPVMLCFLMFALCVTSLLMFTVTKQLLRNLQHI